MNEKYFKYLLVLAAILSLILFYRVVFERKFFSIYAPQPVDVPMAIDTNKSIYYARVTFIEARPLQWCGADLYPKIFRVQNVREDILAEKYCYLQLDTVHNQPCYGQTWGWSITNLTLITPYINGVCDFTRADTKMLNPDTSYYEYIGSGGAVHETYKCGGVDCLTRVKYQSYGASGLLYLKISPTIGIKDCNSLDGEYCSDNKTREVRDYYCPLGYGSDTNCLGKCEYKVTYREVCQENYVCINGKCVLSPEIIKSYEERIEFFKRLVLGILSALIVYLIIFKLVKR